MNETMDHNLIFNSIYSLLWTSIFHPTVCSCSSCYCCCSGSIGHINTQPHIAEWTKGVSSLFCRPGCSSSSSSHNRSGTKRSSSSMSSRPSSLFSPWCLSWMAELRCLSCCDCWWCHCHCHSWVVHMCKRWSILLHLRNNLVQYFSTAQPHALLPSLRCHSNCLVAAATAAAGSLQRYTAPARHVIRLFYFISIFFAPFYVWVRQPASFSFTFFLEPLKFY